MSTVYIMGDVFKQIYKCDFVSESDNNNNNSNINNHCVTVLELS